MEQGCRPCGVAGCGAVRHGVVALWGFGLLLMVVGVGEASVMSAARAVRTATDYSVCPAGGGGFWRLGWRWSERSCSVPVHAPDPSIPSAVQVLLQYPEYLDGLAAEAAAAAAQHMNGEGCVDKRQPVAVAVTSSAAGAGAGAGVIGSVRAGSLYGISCARLRQRRFHVLSLTVSFQPVAVSRCPVSCLPACMPAHVPSFLPASPAHAPTRPPACNLTYLQRAATQGQPPARRRAAAAAGCLLRLRACPPSSTTSFLCRTSGCTRTRRAR